MKPLPGLFPGAGDTTPNLKPDEFPTPDSLLVESSCEDDTPNLNPLLGALDMLGSNLKPEEIGAGSELNLKPVEIGAASDVEPVPNLKAEETGAESDELPALNLKPVEVMTPNFGRTSTEPERREKLN